MSAGILAAASAPALAGWGEVAKLLASDGASNDWFGVSVFISADTDVVATLVGP